MPTFKQIIVLILDGFGVASPSEGNAITAVSTPSIDYLVNNFPSLTLQASGPSVGLPWGERGNSEVGHFNLGAGRIVSQFLQQISLSISSGIFFENPALIGAMEHAKKNGSRLHLAGLVSNGGVHSSEEHLYAILALAADRGIKEVFIHMFTDGRDTPPKAAGESLDRLNRKFLETGVGKIATMSGRFYAMDRGGHWEVTEQTYKAMTAGIGEHSTNPREALLGYYERQIFDETLPPTVICDRDDEPLAKIQDGDAVIFFNFRPDRILQLAKAFTLPNFDKFSRTNPALKNMYFATMTEYEKDLPAAVVFGTLEIRNGLSEVVSQQGWAQFHIAEREKYAHVSSFFNGGREEPWPLEEREIVNSPTSYKERYADVPQMSAHAITDKIVERIKAGTPFIVANFANADMVGHTGIKDSCRRAVAAIDECIGIITNEAKIPGTCFIITADHGNVEEVIEPKSGMINKEHSLNPVPLIVAGLGLNLKKPRTRGYASLASMVPEGVLSDLAPTVLELYGLPKPPEMTAVSLASKLLEQIG